MAAVQVTPPFNFSVPAAQRQGTFQTPEFQISAPASLIFWQLDIPNTTEYEDVLNSVTSTLFVNGVDASTTWNGGRIKNKFGVIDPPPSVMFDISGLPVGTKYQLVVTVARSMTVGVKNGQIS